MLGDALSLGPFYGLPELPKGRVGPFVLLPVLLSFENDATRQELGNADPDTDARLLDLAAELVAYLLLDSEAKAAVDRRAAQKRHDAEERKRARLERKKAKLAREDAAQKTRAERLLAACPAA